LAIEIVLMQWGLVPANAVSLDEYKAYPTSALDQTTSSRAIFGEPFSSAGGNLLPDGRLKDGSVT